MTHKTRGKIFGVTSYSALGMTQPRFRELIQRLATDLPALVEMTGADAIAVRGTSGYSIAFAMRMLVDIPVIVARKKGEASHGGQNVLMHDGDYMSIGKYIFVDDLICTGKTAKGVILDLAGDNPHERATCVAIVEYNKIMESINNGTGYARSLKNIEDDFYVSFLDDDSAACASIPRYSYECR